MSTGFRGPFQDNQNGGNEAIGIPIDVSVPPPNYVFPSPLQNASVAPPNYVPYASYGQPVDTRPSTGFSTTSVQAAGYLENLNVPPPSFPPPQSQLLTGNPVSIPPLMSINIPDVIRALDFIKNKSTGAEGPPGLSVSSNQILPIAQLTPAPSQDDGPLSGPVASLGTPSIKEQYEESLQVLIKARRDLSEMKADHLTKHADYFLRITELDHQILVKQKTIADANELTKTVYQKICSAGNEEEQTAERLQELFQQGQAATFNEIEEKRDLEILELEKYEVNRKFEKKVQELRDKEKIVEELENTCKVLTLAFERSCALLKVEGAMVMEPEDEQVPQLMACLNELRKKFDHDPNIKDEDLTSIELLIIQKSMKHYFTHQIVKRMKKWYRHDVLGEPKMPKESQKRSREKDTTPPPSKAPSPTVQDQTPAPQAPAQPVRKQPAIKQEPITEREPVQPIITPPHQSEAVALTPAQQAPETPAPVQEAPKKMTLKQEPIGESESEPESTHEETVQPEPIQQAPTVEHLWQIPMPPATEAPVQVASKSQMSAHPVPAQHWSTQRVATSPLPPIPTQQSPIQHAPVQQHASPFSRLVPTPIQPKKIMINIRTTNLEQPAQPIDKEKSNEKSGQMQVGGRKRSRTPTVHNDNIVIPTPKKPVHIKAEPVEHID